jgi:SWI/SNF-related matrix-associated actin-dependent regulator 1 of chromatin subfamily A
MDTAMTFSTIANAVCRRYMEEAGQRAVDGLVVDSWAQNVDIDIPRPAGLDYRPYQKAGIVYGLRRNAVLIGDEPGLGKTVQAIGIINCLDDTQRVLVVCPASLRINWQREMNKWLVNRDLTLAIATANWPNTNIVITTYDYLKRFTREIHDGVWDVVIIDEAHISRNRGTTRTDELFGADVRSSAVKKKVANWEKRAKEMMERGEDPGKMPQFAVKPVAARMKIALTGTPIVNRVREMFPLLSWLSRGLQFYDDDAAAKKIIRRAVEAFTNYMHFAKRYCNGRYVKMGSRSFLDAEGSSNLEELQRYLRASLMVRRLKTEVERELPDKMFSVISLPADGLEDLVAQENELVAEKRNRARRARAALELAKVQGTDAFLRAIRDYRREEKEAFTEISEQRKKNAVRKLPLVIEHIRLSLETREKVIVFAHHENVIDELHRELREFRPVILKGATSKARRQEAVDDFQRDPSRRVFIGSIQAAGVGLTLTAASLVIFAELDYVPANIVQAADRAHRIGQTQTVEVQYLILEGSMDIDMLQILDRKSSVCVDALDRKTTDLGEDDDNGSFGAGFVSMIEPAILHVQQLDMGEVDYLAGTLSEPEMNQVLLASAELLEREEREDAPFTINTMDREMISILAGQTMLTREGAAAGYILLRPYARYLSSELRAVVEGMF